MLWQCSRSVQSVCGLAVVLTGAPPLLSHSCTGVTHWSASFTHWPLPLGGAGKWSVCLTKELAKTVHEGNVKGIARIGFALFTQFNAYPCRYSCLVLMSHYMHTSWWGGRLKTIHKSCSNVLTRFQSYFTQPMLEDNTSCFLALNFVQNTFVEQQLWWLA